MWSRTGFSNLSKIDVRSYIIFVGDCPVLAKVFSRILDLYSIDASTLSFS